MGPVLIMRFEYLIMKRTNDLRSSVCDLPTVQYKIPPYGRGNTVSKRTLYPVVVPIISHRSSATRSAIDTALILRGWVQIMLQSAPRPSLIKWSMMYWGTYKRLTIPYLTREDKLKKNAVFIDELALLFLNGQNRLNTRIYRPRKFSNFIKFRLLI